MLSIGNAELALSNTGIWTEGQAVQEDAENIVVAPGGRVQGEAK
jgi:hypothetical protein